MKVFERFVEVKGFGELKNVDDILSFVYQHRIYINDVLEEDFPKDILNVTQEFLDHDFHYDGDEHKAWERFLNSDMNDFEGGE